MEQITIDKEKKEDVVLIDDKPEAAAEPKQTVQDAEEAGLTPEEIELGKKAGAIDDKTTTADRIAEKKADAARADYLDEKDKEEKKKTVAATKTKVEPKPWEKDLPDEEATALNEFTPNEKALYWKQKKEKYRRQQAESEKDKLRIETAFWKGKAEEAAKNSAALAANKPAPIEKPEEELDELGEPKEKVGSKDKPLTEADLERIEKEKAEAAQKLQKEHNERVNKVSEILDQQENSFKEEHPDFDDVWIHTQDILDNIKNEEKFKEYFPDPVQRRGVKAMVGELAQKLLHPDQVRNGDSVAPELAYQIGKLHPKAQESDGGDKPDGNEDDPESAPSALKKRLDKQGQPSSAPLSGAGGRRPVSVNDLTVEDVHKMNDREFAALRKKHPLIVDKLLAE